jgi:hypothetical protein
MFLQVRGGERRSNKVCEDVGIEIINELFMRGVRDFC